eukprot:15434289-Alexandrium_andersonii.AAC.1
MKRRAGCTERSQHAQAQACAIVCSSPEDAPWASAASERQAGKSALQNLLREVRCASADALKQKKSMVARGVR